MPAAKTPLSHPLPVPEPGLLTHDEAASYLRVPPMTLHKWNSDPRRAAPRSVRIGRYRRYRKVDLDAFIEERYAATAAAEATKRPAPKRRKPRARTAA